MFTYKDTSKTKKHFPSIIMVLLVKISNKKKIKPLFKKIINAPYDVPLQYYGIGMLHKTQVKVKGTLNCDINTTTCICKDQITQGTFLLHMLHHSRNLYKPKRVIFEKKRLL